MRSAVAIALLSLAAAVSTVTADVNVAALFSALKYKKSKTSAYLIYQQESSLDLVVPPPNGGPNTVLMPTDYAWYQFFVDYQRGSEYIKADVGHVAARLPDLSTYSSDDFATLMQGLITYQPPFAALCVKLLNHMTLPGNITVKKLQKKHKDDLIENSSSYPLYIVKTHPPTLKAVPSDFDESQFTLRREIDPLYIPRMLDRVSTVIEAGVYKGKNLEVHLVDNVLPYINQTWVDPPLPQPKDAAKTSALSFGFGFLAVLVGAALF